MKPEAIGKKIKELRRKRNLTQQELAEKCGFTNSLLSKIENGQTGSAIATLSKIASALGVSLSWLLQDEEQQSLIILKKEDRQTVPAGEEIGYLYEPLANHSVSSKIEPVLVSVLPENKDLTPYTHDEDEFILVLSGTINLNYNGELQTLNQGDSAYFNGGIPHVFLPANDRKAQVLSIFISKLH
ncbi:helix-turn-helix domain-containing protein [Planomicrobium sp. YIM 101495]|uniref:helix-turn-helix domain-containing protein n=1 Tax=Planomicrobium sp. YIM 101495 TaxID=2665160 RepID=UPI0012B7F4B7|nr:XRE family transcriptional regulator [Planomicrobium sp. YIM 101495]MTD30686.1 helix-turn-helix domain-containing protein [Planomicrobium sp. YIM 101495]